MTPVELASITPYSFSLKYKGFKDLMKREELNLRNVAWLIVSPHLDPKKSHRMEDVWPIDGDRKSGGIMFTKRQIVANLKAYKKIRDRRLASLKSN